VANIFSIIYIVAFSWLVLTILNGYGIAIIDKIAQKSKRKEVINLALKVIYVIVLIITLLLILQKLGFDISALIASLGIGGLAVAFAAKDIIANFFASVMMLFDNSFSQGDWIVCGDIEGTVVEIGFRKTTVRSFDNALIFVPNSKL
ncbi:mechanosensitive ion channel family protein, partial [Campylobacter concisus]